MITNPFKKSVVILIKDNLLEIDKFEYYFSSPWVIFKYDHDGSRLTYEFEFKSGRYLFYQLTHSESGSP